MLLRKRTSGGKKPSFKSETKHSIRFEMWYCPRASVNFVFTNRLSADIKLRPVSNISYENKHKHAHWSTHLPPLRSEVQTPDPMFGKFNIRQLPKVVAYQWSGVYSTEP